MSTVPSGWVALDISNKSRTVDAAEVLQAAEAGQSRNALMATFNATRCQIEAIVPWLRSPGGAIPAPRKRPAPALCHAGKPLSVDKMRAICRQNLVFYASVPKLEHLAVTLPVWPRACAKRIRKAYVRALYAAGVPTREIAVRTGITPTAINNWKRGLPPRKQGRLGARSQRRNDAIFSSVPRPAVVAPKAPAGFNRTKIREMYLAGRAFADIEAALQVSSSCISRNVRDLPRRTKI